LPELALAEGNQQVVTKSGGAFSPSLFTFRSHFAAIHQRYYYDFITLEEGDVTALISCTD